MEITRMPLTIAGQVASYSKGAAVFGARGFVLLSGSVGIDVQTGKIPAGVGEQTRLAWENIRTRLEEAGTSMSNALFMRRYLVGLFPDVYPGRSGL